MRKKYLVGIIILIMVASVVAVTFATKNSDMTTQADIQFSQSNISPSSLYIPLNAPKTVATSKDIIAIASDNKLYIYNNDTTYAVIDLNVGEGERITDIATTSEYVAILFERADTSTYYAIFDIKTRAKHAFDTSMLLAETLDIDADGEFFYFRDASNNLNKLTLTQASITSELVNIPQKPFFANSNNYDYFKGDIYVFNTKSNSIVKLSDTPSVTYPSMPGLTDFAVVDGGFYYIIKSNDDKVLDKLGYYSFDTVKDENAKLAPEYESKNLCGLSAYGDNAYSCNTQSNRVNIFNTKDNVVAISDKYLGDKGSALDRLDTPKDISIHGENIYVADSENSRIVVTNTRSLERVAMALPYKPQLLSAWGGELAVIDSENTLKVYSADTKVLSEPKYSHSLASYGAIADIDSYKGKFIVLTASGSVLLIDNQGVKSIAEIANARLISTSEDSYFMYIMSDSALTRFSFESGKVDRELPIDCSSATAFAVDYIGNAFLLSADKLVRCNRDNYVYAISEEYKLSALGAQFKGELQSSSGDMYVVDTTQHRLVKLGGIGAKSTQDMGYVHPPKTDWNIVNSGVVTSLDDSAKVIIYSAPNNDESIQTISAGVEFLVLSELDYNNSKYYYGVVKGYENQKFYIHKECVTLHERVEYPDNYPTMMPIFPSGAKVREFPFKGADVISVCPQSAQIKLVHNVAGDKDNHVWQWYKVAYKNENGQTIVGYVESDDIFFSSAVTPPKNRIFLKVRAGKIGAMVAMYKEPNESSEAIFTNIADGTKVILGVEVFDESAEFTKVIYDNKVGYIKTSCLMLSGLTSNQIVAIAVSVSCVSIFIMLVALMLLRKKVNKKPKNDFGAPTYDNDNFGQQ